MCRNDQIPLEKVKEYDKIILSPGPGIRSGTIIAIDKEYAAEIYSVFVGYQAMASIRRKLINLSTVYHGVAAPDDVEWKEIGSEQSFIRWFAGRN
jgi:anthranilate synthase component 2